MDDCKLWCLDRAIWVNEIQAEINEQSHQHTRRPSDATLDNTPWR